MFDLVPQRHLDRPGYRPAGVGASTYRRQPHPRVERNLLGEWLERLAADG
ncbi:hypothetical protein ACFV98_00965 [Streptomyces violascens]